MDRERGEYLTILPASSASCGTASPLGGGGAAEEPLGGGGGAEEPLGGGGGAEDCVPI